MTPFLIWDFSPFLYSSDLFSIRYYSLLFAIGLFYLFYKISNDSNLKIDSNLFDKFFFRIIVCMLIGSRIFHCIFYEYAYYSENILEIFIPIRIDSLEFTGYQGLSSHGGFFGATLYLFFSFRRKVKKVIFYKLLDSIFLHALVFISLIRIGNFFNSEIIGKKCYYFFCIAFPYSRYGLDFRHPVQLYEALLYLLLFMVFLFFKSRSLINVGKISLLVISWATIFRFVLEFFKENQSDIIFNFINMGQLLSLSLYFLFLILYGYYYKDIRN